MSKRLEGKIAVITAAGQGIGRATAELYAAEGARVIATDINEEALSTLTSCETRVLDVLDGDAIKALAADLGAVDVLFNCAGFVHAGSLLESTEEEWDFAFNLNVKAMYRMMRAFLPAMLENGGGSIINMSSAASSILGVPNRLIYCASKASVIGMTKATAADYVTEGIRCNAICPGTVHSPSLDERLAATGDYDKAYKEFVARQAMGRIGEPREIAELATYLGSDASAFTTGQTHIIDGGWTNS